MTDTRNGPRVYNRDTAPLDLTGLRLVATVVIDGAYEPTTVRILTNGPADIFWVDDPELNVVTCHNTIRHAINHALKGAGWG